MKKLLLMALLISSSSFAEELQCLKSYSTFKSIYVDSIKITKTGDLNKLKAFEQQYDYTVLFKDKHPGQVYLGSDWMKESEADGVMKIALSMEKTGKLQMLEQKLEKPKANFISSIGEVCVVPSYYDSIFFGEKIRSYGDIIYIRALNGNKWRLYSYIGDEQKQDFDEFFPDFPASVKLSASTTDGASYAQQSTNAAIRTLKYLGVEITPELRKQLKQDQKEIEMRMKANGF